MGGSVLVVVQSHQLSLRTRWGKTRSTAVHAPSNCADAVVEQMVDCGCETPPPSGCETPPTPSACHSAQCVAYW